MWWKPPWLKLPEFVPEKDAANVPHTFIAEMCLDFCRYEGLTPVNKEAIIAIPADPTDRDDGAVSAAGVERGLVGRRIRKPRTRLGLSQVEFAERYAIALANIRQAKNMLDVSRNLSHQLP